jgi:hypothetical protein
MSPAGGASYSVPGGKFVFKDGDVRDLADDVALQLQAAGAIVVGTTGAIGVRPATPTLGAQHLDALTGKHVFWDGKYWRNSDGVRQ